MAAAIVAAAAAAQQKYLKAFRQVGAVDSEHACTLEQVGLKENRTFRRLVDQGYVIATGGGYYVDEARVELHRQRGLKASMIVVGILTFILVVLLLVERSA